MGVPFPSGKHLDALSQDAVSTDVFHIKCPQLEFSVSGLQNKVQEYWVKCGSKTETAAYALRCICSGVRRATIKAQALYPGLPIVFSGGVAANSMLRKELKNLDPIFSEPQFSTDNAMGIAILAYRTQGG